MKEILGILMISVFCTGSSFAEKDCTNEAIQYCSAATTSHDIMTQCIAKVKKSRFGFSCEVLSFCQNTTNWDDALSCMGAGSGFMSDNAVKYCHSIAGFNWNYLLECYSSIVNRKYEADDITSCSGSVSWPETFSCLKNIGKSCFRMPWLCVE